MGGMEFGDAASRTATQAFLSAYQTKTAAETIPAALERSTRTANDAVVALAHTYGLSEGMGTTLVAVALRDSELYYISVGDSGVFHLRGGALRMINHPHVFANLLDAAVARGTMSQADAQNHPERESLTSFIGTESLEEIDRNVEPFPIAEGDVILLASDGLFKTLSQEEMVASIASVNGNRQSLPDALVDQTIARKRDHQDNVTVLSIAVESESASDGRVQAPALPLHEAAIPILSPTAVTRKIVPVAEPAQVSAPPPVPGPEHVPKHVPVPVLEPAATVAGPMGVGQSADARPPDTQPPGPPPPTAKVRARSRVGMLIGFLVLLAMLVGAAGGAWWYFRHGRSMLIANPKAPNPESQVSAPPPTTPVEIKVDPDAPVQEPPPEQPPPSHGKASREKRTAPKVKDPL
jgi:serine/threonine protein phosphatase PrpC